MHIWQHKNLRYMYSEGKRRERGKEEAGKRKEVMYCIYIYIYIHVRTFICIIVCATCIHCLHT